MNLEPLISKENIAEKINQAAERLDALYAGDELVIIGVMKGAICLVADLIRCFHQTSVRIEFIEASSYGDLGTKRGELKVGGLDSTLLAGKHVLVVDDIFDSGQTLYTIVEKLQAAKPRSLRTLVLLEKKVSRELDYKPDEVLFTIENEFVVGYGLDYKELYRGLDGISVIKGG